MKAKVVRSLWLLAVSLSGVPCIASAGEVRIAVAANFSQPAREIAALFEASTEHRALLSFGATGQLFTQITQGAPFDVYLAADADRPERAEAEGYGVPETRFTYAIGRLALFSGEAGRISGPEALLADDVTRIAIANPATAPYGAAALEAMASLAPEARRAEVTGKIVRGTNIAQTYAFVATGNAELGFVSQAQIAGHADGSRWVVPSGLHAPITQQAILLSDAEDRTAAVAFLDFLKGPDAQAVILRYGYGIDVDERG